MTKLTYKEQLLHPNWQRKRLEVLQRADFKCESCFDSEATLHVHHKRYVKGRMAWEYELGELVALCVGCHEDYHEQSEILAQVLTSVSSMGPGCISEVVGLVAGFLNDPGGESSDPHMFYAGQVAIQMSMSSIPIDDLMDLSNAFADCSKTFLPLLRSAIAQARPDH